MIYNYPRVDLGSKISSAMRSGVSCSSLTCSKENLEIGSSASDFRVKTTLSSTMKKKKKNKKVKM